MPEEPVIVTPSPIPAQTWAALRQFLLVFGGAIAAKYLTKEQIDFLLSNDLINLIGGAMALGAFVWGQINTRLQKLKLVAAANAAPDTKFVVSK